MNKLIAGVVIAAALAGAGCKKKKPATGTADAGAGAGTNTGTGTGTGTGAGTSGAADAAGTVMGSNTGSTHAGTNTGAPQTGCVTKLGAEIPQGDIILKKECGPVLIEGEVTIDAKLTIEPGVTINVVENGGLWIGYGKAATLLAEGTAAEPILFQSAGEKVPGWWQGIHLGQESKRSKLAFVTIDNAGSQGGDESGYALKLEGVETSVKNSTFQNGKGFGIWAVHGHEIFTSVVENNSFKGLSTGSARLNPKHLANWGKNLYDDKGVVELTEGQVDKNATMFAGVLYRLMANVGVYRASGAAASPKLTVEPGAVVQGVTGAELYIGYSAAGSIMAVGTAAKPITFTSFDKTKGSWGGIKLYDQARGCAFEHVVVEFAESAEGNGALHVDAPAEATLKNVTFKQVDLGLYVQNGAKVTGAGLKGEEVGTLEFRQPNE